MQKTIVSTKSPVTITLGVVKGVTVTVDNQTIDTEADNSDWNCNTYIYYRLRKINEKKNKFQCINYW